MLALLKVCAKPCMKDNKQHCPGMPTKKGRNFLTRLSSLPPPPPPPAGAAAPRRIYFLCICARLTNAVAPGRICCYVPTAVASMFECFVLGSRGRIGFPPPEKNELVLSIWNGVRRHCTFSTKTKHPVLTRPISNPQKPFSGA